ncbi:ATP-binding protein [Listeria aquatica]|uniref:ATP-binding protein n=1 Tax=Listeria aquatica TaxID=1494960 RepID=UPI00068BAF3A|nr:ATP-binding protein [Listeria aquatica]
MYVQAVLLKSSMIKNFGTKKLINKEVPYVDLGCLTSNLDTKVCVSQQALFNRHCAIVGTTGGGKSYTVARLIENMVANQSKAILLDPTGEYSVMEKGVQSVTIGEDSYFPYQKLTREDLFFLVKPSEGVQKPKLLEAIRSLKAVKIYQKMKSTSEKNGVQNLLKAFVNEDETLVIKAGNNIVEYERFSTKYFSDIESDNLELSIKHLGKQVINECISPPKNSKTFGSRNENDVNFCYGMVNRIYNLINTKVYDDAFNFRDKRLDDQNLTAIIDQFIKEDQQDNFVLRIGFESIGYEFQAREILANAIGRYLLKLAREKQFKENPLVFILDEAHQFLNKIVVDDFFQSTALSSFEQISKESRKNGLFLCLSTQMPRDIPTGTLSQMGTFIVHRLINYNDKEAIRQSCSSANSDILSYLPILGEGEAILTGVDFSMPLSIKVSKPNVPPDSSTPMFKVQK